MPYTLTVIVRAPSGEIMYETDVIEFEEWLTACEASAHALNVANRIATDAKEYDPEWDE